MSRVRQHTPTTQQKQEITVGKLADFEELLTRELADIRSRLSALEQSAPEPNGNVFRVNRVSQFFDALKSDTHIKFDTDEVLELGDTAKLQGLRNVTIEGPVTLMHSAQHTMRLVDCKGITLRNFRLEAGAGNQVDCLNLYQCEDVHLNHLSLRHGTDENLGITDCRDVTVEWCIIAESLKPHSCGCLIREKTNEIHLHHNLFAHNYARNPQWGQADDKNAVFTFHNNVIYNEGVGGLSRAAVEWKKNGTLRAYRNYYKAGPDKNANRDWAMSAIDGSVGLFGNNINGVSSWLRPNDAARSTVREFIDYSNWEFADEAYVSVLESAGCTPRDATDQRIVKDVENGTGKIR